MDVNRSLGELAEQLLRATRASRVTVRAALVAGEPGTALLAEALAPGIESMADAPQAGIAEAPTYVYLRSKRIPLVQDDCSQAPLPPAMLTQRYHVGAQMLGPLLDPNGQDLIGTVSVHQVGHTRSWSGADRAALEETVAAVAEILFSGR
jgi:GAF domain-containing protein